MKSNTQIANDVNEAKYKSRRAATSPWMIRLARLGYTVKGIVYVVIGWLAGMLAIGHGGKATDQSGAIQTINSLPLGKFLLVVVAIGLLGFALWSFIQALFDTEGKGRDAKGIASRIGYAVVGASYALLSYATFQIVAGTGSGASNSTSRTQDWTALLLNQHFGPALVIIVGIGVLVVEFYMFVKDYYAIFKYRHNMEKCNARVRRLRIDHGSD